MTNSNDKSIYAVTRVPRPETLRKLERMREMRAAGMSWAKIADELECAPQNAFEMAKRWGVRFEAARLLNVEASEIAAAERASTTRKEKRR